MSNALYVCPVDNCTGRAYAHPDGTLPEPRCPEHGDKMELAEGQTVDTQFNPKDFEMERGMTETPTSIDAVTRDGRVVGEEVGLGSPAHGIPPAKASTAKASSAASSSSAKSEAKK